MFIATSILRFFPCSPSLSRGRGVVQIRFCSDHEEKWLRKVWEPRGRLIPRWPDTYHVFVDRRRSGRPTLMAFLHRSRDHRWQNDDGDDDDDKPPQNGRRLERRDFDEHPVVRRHVVIVRKWSSYPTTRAATQIPNQHTGV